MCVIPRMMSIRVDELRRALHYTDGAASSGRSQPDRRLPVRRPWSSAARPVRRWTGPPERGARARCWPRRRSHAQFDPQRAYRQSEAVKQRYPDPPVRFETPGFAPGRTDFTTHEDMMAFITDLQRRADNLQVRIAGQSQEGRAIPALVFSNSRATAPADLLRLNRPVVLLVGLQHGNEPAGGEAMLALARELAVGPLKPLLDRITVVIVPRANPDGAYYFTRSPYANHRHQPRSRQGRPARDGGAAPPWSTSSSLTCSPTRTSSASPRAGSRSSACCSRTTSRCSTRPIPTCRAALTRARGAALSARPACATWSGRATRTSGTTRRPTTRRTSASSMGGTTPDIGRNFAGPAERRFVPDRDPRRGHRPGQLRAPGAQPRRRDDEPAQHHRGERRSSC